MDCKECARLAWVFRDEETQPLCQRCANARIAELEARLPKTRDGVIPGLRREEDCVVYREDGERGIVCFDSLVGWIVWPDPEETLRDTDWPKAPENCYSTPEAAKAEQERNND